VLLTVIATFALYLFSLTYRPLLYAGFLVQTAYLFYRGFSLGRLPLVGVHDTLNFLSASTVVFALGVHFYMRQKRDFFVMLSALAAAFTAFSLLQKPHSTPLPPVLKTYWFELHVALSFFSYALFAVAAMLGIIYLREGEQALEKLQYKAAFVGYSFFSLSMIFGGVWAYLAWGTYWLWTPKELWTTMVWLLYGLYLHARLTSRWAGKPSAIMGIAGFAVVMFTYLGVGLLMKSSHAF
jgi:ABC-type transport system involved in cytochrome c biogenesis permease subunit